MSYSKLRGARKTKKKDEVVVENEKSTLDASEDMFQQQRQRIIDTIISHPYFVIGSVAAVVLMVAAVFGVRSIVKKGNDDNAANFFKIEKVYASQVGDEQTYKTENDKMKKVVEVYASVKSTFSNTLYKDIAAFYSAKAHYKLNEYGKAIDLFKLVQKSSAIDSDIKFGAYEGEAFCYFDRDDYDHAIVVWKKYLGLTSNIYKDNALYYIGLAYEKKGDNAKALEFFKKLKNDYPESVLLKKVEAKLPKDKKEDKKS